MRRHWKEQAELQKLALHPGQQTERLEEGVAFSQWMMVAVCYGRGKQAIILHKIRQWNSTVLRQFQKIHNEWMNEVTFQGQKRIEI